MVRVFGNHKRRTLEVRKYATEKLLERLRKCWKPCKRETSARRVTIFTNTLLGYYQVYPREKLILSWYIISFSLTFFLAQISFTTAYICTIHLGFVAMLLSSASTFSNDVWLLFSVITLSIVENAPTYWTFLITYRPCTFIATRSWGWNNDEINIQRLRPTEMKIRLIISVKRKYIPGVCFFFFTQYFCNTSVKTVTA